MRVESYGISDRGRRRAQNEDAFLIRDDLGLFVVADGMGGHAAGEVAAGIAVHEIEAVVEATREHGEKTWPEHWQVQLSLNANRLVQAILGAHRRVMRAVEAANELKGMGATVVAALLDQEAGRVTVAHVGDSRAYLLRAGELQLLTSDHSWVHEQVVAGLLSEEAARNHPLKNVVTRALGGMQEPSVDFSELGVQEGDTLLLCSDGLNTMLSDHEIRGIVASSVSLGQAANRLVAEANERGGLDNITVVLVRLSP
ncbi:MAG: Stp1/IreP family PP2C-type Ser/Thr phosphatase [Thermoanaerobaculum sp.]|nr:Stp1/IreP family PP2C-type Ser/Thr phosphatase [Thermoanaerobaculum sp.]